MRSREKKASGLGGFASRGRKKRKAGRGKWVAREKGVREERGFEFFFLNSFQICFSNFQTSIKQETMHSNHDAQSLIIYNFIK
jgi:hypothetical protein